MAKPFSSFCAAMKIHMTEATQNKLSSDNTYNIVPRGEVVVKGKGRMNTYFLLAKNGNVRDQCSTTHAIKCQQCDIPLVRCNERNKHEDRETKNESTIKETNIETNEKALCFRAPQQGNSSSTMRTDESVLLHKKNMLQYDKSSEYSNNFTNKNQYKKYFHNDKSHMASLWVTNPHDKETSVTQFLNDCSTNAGLQTNVSQASVSSESLCDEKNDHSTLAAHITSTTAW